VSPDSDNAREKIIEIAEQVFTEDGARHFTVDAVAAKLGISTGGLLCYFHDKEALLKAMLDRRVKHATEHREKTHISQGATNQKGLVSDHVLGLEESHKQKQKMQGALLAAIAHDTQAPLPYQQDFRNSLDEFCRGGLRPERAAVILLAVEGMKLLEVFSLLTLTPRERKSIIHEIMRLARKEKHA